MVYTCSMAETYLVSLAMNDKRGNFENSLISPYSTENGLFLILSHQPEEYCQGTRTQIGFIEAE